MKTKSGFSRPAFSSACLAASRPATLGLRWWLMPTPALVVMGVPPPVCYEHLSLGRVVQHHSNALTLTARETGNHLSVALRSRLETQPQRDVCLKCAHGSMSSQSAVVASANRVL